MSAFIWPKHVKDEPQMLVRLVRVLHWIGTFITLIGASIAVIFAVIGAYQLATQPDDPWGQYSSNFWGGLFAMVLCLLAYFPFRGLRYILGGE